MEAVTKGAGIVSGVGAAWAASRSLGRNLKGQCLAHVLPKATVESTFEKVCRVAPDPPRHRRGRVRAWHKF
jgi:hypothetical protein